MLPLGTFMFALKAHVTSKTHMGLSARVSTCALINILTWCQVCLAREPGNQSQFSRFCVLSSFVFMGVFMGDDAVFVVVLESSDIGMDTQKA